jgi:hypothetical protein
MVPYLTTKLFLFVQLNYLFIIILGKACTQLQQPAHSVMIGASNFAGNSVVFVCDPGYRMQGTSQLTCVDQRGFALWSDMATNAIYKMINKNTTLLSEQFRNLMK